MIQQFYVVSAEKKDGTKVYARFSENGSGSYSASITNSPMGARHFPIDCPQDVITWMERIKSSLGRSCVVSTIKVMVFEFEIREIGDDDSDWNKALRMNAIAKLTDQEVIALGLEAHAIERKMSAD